MKSYNTILFLLFAIVIGHKPLDINPALFGNIRADEVSSGTFYAREDFDQVPKIDIHIHLNTPDKSFLQLARANNFQFLDIVDDRPFGLPMEKQQEIAIQLLHSNPRQMRFATTFPVEDWESPGWVDSTIRRLEKSFGKGATAVKIWKNIGMDLRDADGTFVMVDHPRLDTIIEFLVKNKIPLVGHNGEPLDCWLPLDKMTFNKGYYSRHPEYHMYLHPEYPSYDDQILARDRMLQKHPSLRFMGAHLGSLEWSLEELAKRLDAFPNMWVDLTRMSNLKLHTLNDREKARAFFLKYQDRLIYGTDTAVNATARQGERNKSIRNNWLRDWQFFVTEDEIFLDGYGNLKGLKLPRAVVDKIYYVNARNFLGWTDV